MLLLSKSRWHPSKVCMVVTIIAITILLGAQFHHQPKNLMVAQQRLDQPLPRTGDQHYFPHEIETSPYSMESFCHRWDPSVAKNRSLQPFDVWLTHHPTWVVSNETDTQFCVKQGNLNENPHIRQHLQFYTNQFHSSCDRVHLRTM